MRTIKCEEMNKILGTEIECCPICHDKYMETIMRNYFARLVKLPSGEMVKTNTCCKFIEVFNDLEVSVCLTLMK